MTARATASFSALSISTTTDQVYETLNRALITLQLPPGRKVSEAEIAKQFGVSRQPVRDAFFRLSQQGLLLIRPQRATLVTLISQASVGQAAFVRSALEAACIREAARVRSPEDLENLDRILASQAEALKHADHALFHALDNDLHQRICEISGHGHVWPLVQDQKAHIDRVRFLALSFERQTAFEQHQDIVAALKAQDPDQAVAHLHAHLGRIDLLLRTVYADHPDYFEDAPA